MPTQFGGRGLAFTQKEGVSSTSANRAGIPRSSSAIVECALGVGWQMPMARWLKRSADEAAGVGSLDDLKAADLVDAMGRLHRHRCHILDLVSPTPGRVLFGPAVTISYFPSCSAGLDPERYNLQNLFYEAVGDHPEGKVMVLASNGYTAVSMGVARSCRAFRSMAAPASSPMAGCATSTSSQSTTSPPTAPARPPSGGAVRSPRSKPTCPWSSRASA